MCQDVTFEEFPAITIGGATGDYFVTCPVTSCRWAEYAIDSVVNGDAGTGAVVVSGNSAPAALDYAGLSTSVLNDNAVLHAVPIRVPATTTQQINSSWERITNSSKKVFVRIDASASCSMYVVLRFRIKVLATIPGPSVAVHPDFQEKLNEARAETTKQRMAKMGIPAYAEEK